MPFSIYMVSTLESDNFGICEIFNWFEEHFWYRDYIISSLSRLLINEVHLFVQSMTNNIYHIDWVDCISMWHATMFDISLLYSLKLPYIWNKTRTYMYASHICAWTVCFCVNVWKTMKKIPAKLSIVHLSLLDIPFPIALATNGKNLSQSICESSDFKLICENINFNENFSQTLTCLYNHYNVNSQRNLFITYFVLRNSVQFSNNTHFCRRNMKRTMA